LSSFLSHLRVSVIESEPPQAAPRPVPGRGNLSSNLVTEIAIHPEIVQLAAHNLQPRDTSYREAS
jgi:hypothetical protein